MLTDEQRGSLRELTVQVLLGLRAEYLQTASANPLKHWDQLQDRLRIAARTSTSSAEWVTAMTRSLGLGAPSSARSLATDRLYHATDGHGLSTAWLDLLEEEYGLLMAMTRLEAEERKARRDQAALEESV